MPQPATKTAEQTQTQTQQGKVETKPEPEEGGSTETSPQQERVQKSGYSVLLVEDEPLLANLLERRLNSEGFEVRRAEDGKEALEQVKANSFDIILLDIILPKVSGFEFLEEIREDPQIEDVPVVIISNLGQESDIEKGKKLGAVGYFVKAQLSIDELVDQVKEYLDSQS